MHRHRRHHSQELTNVQYTPELARLELTREADDRLTRIEISQQELTRRLSAVRAEKSPPSSLLFRYCLLLLAPARSLCRSKQMC